MSAEKALLDASPVPVKKIWVNKINKQDHWKHGVLWKITNQK